MNFDELKKELEPIKRGGVKIDDENIKNALYRAIQKIALKTTPLNLITKDMTQNIIRECEVDGYLIKESGYYLREPYDSDEIDIDKKLLPTLLYLVAYEFAPSKEQSRLINLAKDEITSYKWYLYEIANADTFELDSIIEPYSVVASIEGNRYSFDESFIDSIDSYLIGKNISSIRDMRYIKRYLAYCDGDIEDEAMVALDIVLAQRVISPSPSMYETILSISPYEDITLSTTRFLSDMQLLADEADDIVGFEL
jgi:hypothetical protein